MSSLSEWIGDIVNDELHFTKALRLLRNYSLVEGVNESDSYATHPVVHRWAYHFQEASSRKKLAQLSTVIVGAAVPSSSSQDFTTLQRRLLPHTQICSAWVETNQFELSSHYDKGGSKEDHEEDGRIIIHDAIYQLGLLYVDQGKLEEAEKLC